MHKAMCLQIHSGTALPRASVTSKSSNRMLIMHLTDCEKHF